MRNLVITIVALVLAGASGFAAVALRHNGNPACASAASTAGESPCAVKGATTMTGCVPITGKIAGNFDAAMSGVCRFACATQIPYDARDVLAQPGAKPARLTQCPVSGVVFLVDASRPRVRVAGEEYATCCDRCAKKLERDPRHYLKS